MKNRFRHFPSTALAILILGLAPGALAQDNVGDESTVIYPASYFEEFSPITAQDMLDRIPGMSSRGGPGGGGPPRGFSSGGPPGAGPSNVTRGGRGFGGGRSGGNEILINGKRTAGKNNNTSGILDRITAAQVDHIEIIRDTSGSLDVRGSGQVVNVVLFEELSDTSFSYDVNMDRYVGDEVRPGGNFALSGQAGGLSYVVSASATPRYYEQTTRENSVLGDYSPNDFIWEERITDASTYEFSTNLDYQFSANSSARLNALFTQNDRPQSVMRHITDLKVESNMQDIEREAIPGESNSWEIGGDYEYLGADNSRFKVLFIANENDNSSLRERFDVLAGGEEKNLFLSTNSLITERIVRGSYTFDIGDSMDLELGAEGAQTVLDSALALGIAGSGTPSQTVGGLVPINVSNAVSEVEEIRYEPFAIHNWIINPRLTLESTLLYETSTISQTGDFNNSRDFEFLKPKVDLRYNVTPQLQLRGSVERVVLQLSFADFVAANDDQDDDSNTQAGNINLRQEWLWKYDFNAEYRLPNDYGVLDGNIYYHAHHDRIERIDVTVDENNLQSANGNIGDGNMWGFRGNAAIRMRMFDMPNLQLTASLTVEDSSIMDPFLGYERRFQNMARGFNSFGFRHDIPQWNLNWGGRWMNRHDGNILRIDIDDIEYASGDPRGSLFVEYIDSRGLTWRLEGQSLSNPESCRERLRYLGRVSAGILEEIEYRCSMSGRVINFKVSGTF
ncbi:MAG: TonB-dependent receptor [Gammaproteobacteria bacterium]|nr:TonB-dependent receptor [Gammaproteobacteria bacterium]MDE0480634.1 TonB-dependent receptor [Gammaproteobacteria bacterium]